MDVIRTGRKGRHSNTLEKYHIYKISTDNLHMNHIYIDTYIEPHISGGGGGGGNSSRSS
jgi:hypothetical protein